MTDLFSPLNLFNKTLKNRVVLAPLTRGRNTDRVPNQLMQEYYLQRNGAGLLITEATAVNEEGYGWVGAPGIYTDQQVDAWRQIVDAVHKENGVIVSQLWHVGRAGHTEFLDEKPMLAPSAVAIRGYGVYAYSGKLAHETPVAMTLEDIQRTLADFKTATENAAKAGFDAVEIHGANGYLPNQFLDPTANQRTDEFGGSVENRARFLLHIVDDAIEVLGAERVAVRLSPNGIYNDMGHEDFWETYEYTIRELDKRQIAYLHVMDGLAFGFHEKGTPMTLKDIRQWFSGCLMGNCGYTPETAQVRVADGDADLIAFGRPFITNPDLPERIKHGQPLADFSDPSHWYTADAEGYTTYLTYGSAS